MNNPVRYICPGCAGLYGAEWPEALSVPTIMHGCENCGLVTDLFPVDAFNWLEGKPKKWSES